MSLTPDDTMIALLAAGLGAHIKPGRGDPLNAEAGVKERQPYDEVRNARCAEHPRKG